MPFNSAICVDTFILILGRVEWFDCGCPCTITIKFLFDGVANHCGRVGRGWRGCSSLRHCFMRSFVEIRVRVLFWKTWLVMKSKGKNKGILKDQIFQNRCTSECYVYVPREMILTRKTDNKIKKYINKYSSTFGRQEDWLTLHTSDPKSVTLEILAKL